MQLQFCTVFGTFITLNFQQMILKIMLMWATFGDRAFSVAGPVIWNSIPAAVREADTVSSFKRKLKTHFFLCALTMFDFDFCNALPVRARVGSGTITAIYYYYYYMVYFLMFWSQSKVCLC